MYITLGKKNTLVKREESKKTGANASVPDVERHERRSKRDKTSGVNPVMLTTGVDWCTSILVTN